MEIQSITVTDVHQAITVYSPKGRHTEMKNRSSYGLSICIDGQITYTQNGEEYIEDSAHAVILPRGQSYSIRGDVTGSFPVINFSTVDPLEDRITVLRVRNIDFLIKCYEEIHRLSSAGGSRAKILSLFYEMLNELSASADVDILEPAMKFLHDNYQNPNITNTLLADQCKISEVYFRKLFTHHLGIPPKQYILQLRLRHAKQLLSEGKQKIWAIAVDCGFDSPAHFCRSFKTHVGITPSEYRQKNQFYEI